VRGPAYACPLCGATQTLLAQAIQLVESTNQKSLDVYTHVVKCLNTPWSGGSDQPALLAGDSSAPPGDSSQAPSDGSASGDEKHTGNIVSAPPSFAAPPLDPALSSPLSTGLGANSRLGMFAPPATTLRAPGRGWWTSCRSGWRSE